MKSAMFTLLLILGAAPAFSQTVTPPILPCSSNCQFDASGDLGLAGVLSSGDSTFRSLVGGGTALATTASTSTVFNVVSGKWTADANGVSSAWIKSRNTTPGGHTIISSGDSYGKIFVYGDDGTTYRAVGGLYWGNVGTPATGDLRSQFVVEVAGSTGVVTALVINGFGGAITVGAGGTKIADTSGHLFGLIQPSAKTSAYPVVSGDSGTHFDNQGSSGEVDFTLPAAAAGLHYCFSVLTAQILKVIANGTDKIAIAASNSTAGGNVLASALYASVCIEAHATGQWFTRSTADKAQWTVN